MSDDRMRGEVNRLYWDSPAPVGEIAHRLGISRRALYAALEPRGAGARCPRCGGELVYLNRSRRDTGRPTCPACGMEPDIALLREATAEAGAALRRKADRAQGAAGADAERPPIHAAGALRRSRTLLIIGAALTGAATGAIIVLLRRR